MAGIGYDLEEGGDSFGSDCSQALSKITDWGALARSAKFRPGEMAARIPISLRQLERFFIDYFRQRPQEWTVELRCRLARDLVATGYSNKGVVAELHYANEPQLCHDFQKVYGNSPQSFAPLFGREVQPKEAALAWTI